MTDAATEHLNTLDVLAFVGTHADLTRRQLEEAVSREKLVSVASAKRMVDQCIQLGFLEEVATKKARGRSGRGVTLTEAGRIELAIE